MRDKASLMETTHGLHLTVMYAGPLHHEAREYVAWQMSSILTEFQNLRNEPWQERVDQMLHLRRHCLADPGKTIGDMEYSMSDLSEETVDAVADLAINGRLDLSRYESEGQEGCLLYTSPSPRD